MKYDYYIKKLNKWAKKIKKCKYRAINKWARTKAYENYFRFYDLLPFIFKPVIYEKLTKKTKLKLCNKMK